MSDIVKDDVNRGYLNFIKRISSLTSKNKSKNLIKLTLFFLLKLFLNFVRILFIPLMFLYGILLIIFLNVRLFFFRKQQLPEPHLKAIGFIREFICQYPLHLYPIVFKSLEIAFIKENVQKILSENKNGIIELAIGEGTLSGKIFSKGDNIVALDLNPYSLVHTKNYEHISERIVADCLNPPVEKNGANFLISNNFLHHVSNKEYVVGNWAKIAPYALFNENTNYWASAWSLAYFFKMIGLKSLAKRTAEKIEGINLQTLWTGDKLQDLVEKYYKVIERKSFLNEKVFFFSSICSGLLLSFGPPTPWVIKKILLSRPLKSLTQVISFQMAKVLIEYDAFLQRDKDTFLCWFAKSKEVEDNRSHDHIGFVCPDCRKPLRDKKCDSCKNTFKEIDEMLFLLPKHLKAEVNYSSAASGALDKEHL